MDRGEVNEGEVHDIAHFEGLRRLAQERHKVVAYEPNLVRHEGSLVAIVENGKHKKQIVIHFARPIFHRPSMKLQPWEIQDLRPHHWSPLLLRPRLDQLRDAR